MDKKKLLIIIILLILLIILIYIIFNKKEIVNYDNLEITSKEFYELYESDDRVVILIYRDNCYKCEEYLNEIKEIVTENNVKIYRLNTDKLPQDDYKIFDLCHIEGTPNLVIINKKEVINTLRDSKSKDDVISFLKKNKII